MNIFQFVAKNKPILIAWILTLISVVASIVLWCVTFVYPGGNSYCEIARYYETHPEKCGKTKIEEVTVSRSIIDHTLRFVFYTEGSTLEIAYRGFGSTRPNSIIYMFGEEYIEYTDNHESNRSANLNDYAVRLIEELSEACLETVFKYDNVVDDTGKIINTSGVMQDFFKYNSYVVTRIIIFSCLSALVLGLLIVVIIRTIKIKKDSYYIKRENRFDGEQIVDDVVQKTWEAVLSFCKEKAFVSTKSRIKIALSRYGVILYKGELVISNIAYNIYGYSEIEKAAVKKALSAAIYNKFISLCESELSVVEKESYSLVKLHKYYNYDEGNGLSKLDVGIKLVGDNCVIINVQHNPF